MNGVIDHDIDAIGSCPDDDPAGTHVPGCPCRAGGDAEYVTLRLNAMRCVVCGHRLDDMDGCDSCAADREAAEQDFNEEYDREGQPEFNGAFDA